MSARCDDANRRLCNQAFFTAICIDEDEEARAGYARPFDALVDVELQRSALSWAQDARNEDEVRTRTESGSSVAGSHLAQMGFLLTRLSIIAPKAAELYNRWSGEVCGWDDGCLYGPLEPPVGAVEGRHVTPRTFLPPDLTLKLAADYEAGATARGLAREHGIHRTTVVRHLRRAGVVTGQRRMADSEALVDRARALRGEGRSLRAIGVELGISHPSVKRLLDA